MYVYTMARYSTAVPDETESRSEASNSLSYAAGGEDYTAGCVEENTESRKK